MKIEDFLEITDIYEQPFGRDYTVYTIEDELCEIWYHKKDKYYTIIENDIKVFKTDNIFELKCFFTYLTAKDIKEYLISKNFEKVEENKYSLEYKGEEIFVKLNKESARLIIGIFSFGLSFDRLFKVINNLI